MFIGDSHFSFLLLPLLLKYLFHSCSRCRKDRAKINIILIYKISSFGDGERIEHSVHLPLITEVLSTVIEEGKEKLLNRSESFRFLFVY